MAAEAVLIRLTAEGRLVEGEFRPGGTEREWTDAGVLRMLRSRSLARLRHEIEPVDHTVLGRFVTTWHGVVKRRHGADALLDAIEQLQGAPLPASILETEILPARIELYDPADLDAVTAAGEVVWVGVEPIGERDGRVALYLAEHLPRLLPPEAAIRLKADPRQLRSAKKAGSRRRHVGSGFSRTLTSTRGRRKSWNSCGPRARRFLVRCTKRPAAGYPAETVQALWNLAWKGLVTNDTFHALRAFTRTRAPRDSSARSARGRRHEAVAFRSRRLAPPSAEGRWTLVRTGPPATDATKWSAAIAQQLLARHGVVTREGVAAEGIPGGFGSVYPVLKALEETGRVRRGYFVAGLGATQFSLPGALDLLRSLRDAGGNDTPEVAVLAATDPANPYGATLKWPASRRLNAATRGKPADARAAVRLCEFSGFALNVVESIRPGAGRRVRWARW